jgi:hypothetical protein
MKDQNAAIERLAPHLDARTAGQIYNMADKMTTLYQRDGEIQATASERMAAYAEKQTTESAVAKTQRHQEFAASVEDTFKEFGDKIPSLLNATGEKSDIYEPMIEKAKGMDFESLDNQSKSFAAMAAMVLPHLVKDYKELRATLSDKDSTLRGMRGSSPTPGKGAPQGNAPKKAQSAEDQLAAFFDADFS